MQYREVSVMRKITAEQLTRLDNISKCRVMKEIIKGNIKYVEFNQLDMGTANNSPVKPQNQF